MPIYSIAHKFIKLINEIIPKRKNQILFVSIPDFADNSLAMYQYMVEKGLSSKYRLIWAISKKNLKNSLAIQGIAVCDQESLSGLFDFFRSSYIITTHNNYGGLKAHNQFLINVWHGMPLKAIGFVDNIEDKQLLPEIKKGAEADDILIATSIIAKSALIHSFYMNPNKVYITGQPRNDKLFKNSSHENLEKIIGRNVKKYKNIIFYIPTYRKDSSKVKNCPDSYNVFSIEGYNYKKFLKFLNSENILFILKLHPFEEEQLIRHLDNSNILKSDNIFLMTNNILQEFNKDLYDILGAADLLITDYSSVYFDYLLLNKPIIFVPTDLNDYISSRGFVLEPYDFWTPGPKALCFDELLSEIIKSFEEKTYYENERTIINNIINKYKDNNSSERVFKIIQDHSQ